jgi:hypothetical protein
MTHLPRETILPLKVRPDTLLGYKAAQVHALLKDNGIETGDVDCKQGCLVYGAAALDTELADQFWDIGFQDVDDTDDQGLTALMKLRYSTDHSRSTPLGHLEMASWLIEKGADTALCPIIYDFSALHVLGAILGWSIAEWTESSYQLTSSYEAVVHSIILADSHDSCERHCSSGDVLPSRRFLVGLSIQIVMLTSLEEGPSPSRQMCLQHCDRKSLNLLRERSFKRYFDSLHSGP